MCLGGRVLRWGRRGAAMSSRPVAAVTSLQPRQPEIGVAILSEMDSDFPCSTKAAMTAGRRNRASGELPRVQENRRCLQGFALRPSSQATGYMLAGELSAAGGGARRGLHS
jgi:hypothetical protein